MTNNIPAVIEVIKYIYDNIMYAELNTKLDYCQVCNFEGEVEMIDEGGKLKWKCPKCGNMDERLLNVARRACGYITTHSVNQGRMNEFKDRYVHLG